METLTKLDVIHKKKKNNFRVEGTVEKRDGKGLSPRGPALQSVQLNLVRKWNYRNADDWIGFCKRFVRLRGPIYCSKYLGRDHRGIMRKIGNPPIWIFYRTEDRFHACWRQRVCMCVCMYGSAFVWTRPYGCGIWINLEDILCALLATSWRL